MTAWWELAGVPASGKLPTYQQEVPGDFRQTVERISQRGTMIPRSDAPDDILASGAPHSMREKKILVWGGGGAACFLGAHDSVLSAKELFRIAREVRTATGAAMGVWRVGARPFKGGAGAWRWAEGWRDSCVPLRSTSLFDHLLGAEQLVTSFGKCGDFFNGTGFTRSIPVEATAAAWADLLKTLSTTPRGLIVVSLFDDVGRLPPKQFAPALAEQLVQFDAQLLQLQRLLKPEDCVCVISDQARDVRRPQHESRECVPLLVFGPKLARGVNLGDRMSYADLGQTIVEAFDGARLSVGESFLAALRSG
ncbi:phosphopentomutase [Nitrospira sp.]|nr:phosphopentomutase [Nitrospira sp.]